MPKLTIVLTIAGILGMSFFALSQISDQNEYTGVREYMKPKTDTTPPTIEFVNFQDRDIVYEDIVYVEVSVTDDTTSSKDILVE